MYVHIHMCDIIQQLKYTLNIVLSVLLLRSLLIHLSQTGVLQMVSAGAGGEKVKDRISISLIQKLLLFTGSL